MKTFKSQIKELKKELNVLKSLKVKEDEQRKVDCKLRSRSITNDRDSNTKLKCENEYLQTLVSELYMLKNSLDARVKSMQEENKTLKKSLLLFQHGISLKTTNVKCDNAKDQTFKPPGHGGFEITSNEGTVDINVLENETKNKSLAKETVCKDTSSGKETNPRR